MQDWKQFICTENIPFTLEQFLSPQMVHMQYRCAIRFSLSSSLLGEMYFTFPKQEQFRLGILLTQSILLLFRAEQQGVVITCSLGSLKLMRWSAYLWGSYPSIDRKICKFCCNSWKEKGYVYRRLFIFLASCFPQMCSRRLYFYFKLPD